MFHGDINKQRLGEWERGSKDWNRVYCVQESFFWFVNQIYMEFSRK